MKSRLLQILFCCFSGIFLHAQSPFGFQRDQSIPVFPEASLVPFANAWAGGLNAPQFNQADLNADGKPDLILFDRSGNKILPFLKSDSGFRYAPVYEQFFPEIQYWLIMRDYNGDNKPDIFTSTGNDIAIYRNTTQTGEDISFELMSPELHSNYGNGELNLFVSPVDYPAIEDIDGDGDLDIITFYILGTCVEYHQNLSQELFGHSDSLRFRLESDNWGRFTEDPLSNGVYLSDSCDGPDHGLRHTGSSLLIHDIDHDSDPDLLLGDVSYPELLVLINSRNVNTDIIVPTPGNYPAIYGDYSVPVFPAPFKVFIDGDNLPDLVIAPNTDDQSLNKNNQCRLYRSASGSFDFTEDAGVFLSNEILDMGRGAYPVLSDLDNDGDHDLIIGNYGEFEPPLIETQNGFYRASISLYENTGNNLNPQFAFRSDDIGNFRAIGIQHLASAAGDLTGDNRADLVVTTIDKHLHFLKQIGSNGDFEFLEIPGLMDTIHDENFPTPVILDLNEDGRNDIIMGGKSGYFRYYENTGSVTQPVFSDQPTITQLGNAETKDEGRSNFGYSAPAFFKHDEKLYLFSGSEAGKIFLWEVNQQNLSAPFTLIDSTLQDMDEGEWSSVTTTDLNNDGFPELVTGNRRGGLSFYKGTEPLSVQTVQKVSSFSIYPNPGKEIITIRNWNEPGKSIIFIYDLMGRKKISIERDLNLLSAIDISSLETGIYLIWIKNRGKYNFSKLLKVDPH